MKADLLKRMFRAIATDDEVAVERLLDSIVEENYSMASRIVKDTLDVGLVKPYDPENTSKKHTKYVPFWA